MQVNSVNNSNLNQTAKLNKDNGNKKKEIICDCSVNHDSVRC